VTTNSLRYYHGNYDFKSILIILDSQAPNDPYQSSIWATYNFYNALIKGNSDDCHRTITFDEMEESTQKLDSSDKQIHWIWFRNTGFYLPNKILSRARSWITLNPEFRFYLWSNLNDKSELLDFISQLNDENKNYFLNGTITIKYKNDTLDEIKRFYSHYHSQLNNAYKKFYDDLFNNGYRINTLFLIDTFRAIILNLYGGIYCDFNDTLCFFPMKYLLPLYKNEFFVGTDSYPEQPALRNNYFMYKSKNTEEMSKQDEFLNMTIEVINRAINRYYHMTSMDYIKLYTNICLELLTSLAKNPQILSEIFTRLQLPTLVIIMNDDKKKTISRMMSIISSIFSYLSQKIISLQPLAQQLNNELASFAHPALDKYMIKYKRRRLRKKMPTVFNIDTSTSDPDQLRTLIEEIRELTSTTEYYNYFLLDYAKIMINGDLILDTNIAFLKDIKNLVPFSKSTKMSFLTLMTHTYASSSYGGAIAYTSESDFKDNLRLEFL